jgi:hypothetical protein
MCEVDPLWRATTDRPAPKEQGLPAAAEAEKEEPPVSWQRSSSITDGRTSPRTAASPSGHMRAGPRSSVAAAMPRHVMHPIASENSSHRSSTVFVGYGTMRRSRRTSLKRTAVGARRVHRALVKAVAG